MNSSTDLPHDDSAWTGTCRIPGGHGLCRGLRVLGRTAGPPDLSSQAGSDPHPRPTGSRLRGRLARKCGRHLGPWLVCAGGRGRAASRAVPARQCRQPLASPLYRRCPARTRPPGAADRLPRLWGQRRSAVRARARTRRPRGLGSSRQRARYTACRYCHLRPFARRRCRRATCSRSRPRRAGARVDLHPTARHRCRALSLCAGRRAAALRLRYAGGADADGLPRIDRAQPG